MFSTKLSRAAHRASCLSTAIPPTTIAPRPAQCAITRQPGRRRQSSSKASCPPDSSANGGKSSPTGKPDAASAAAIVEPVLNQQNSKRIARTKRPRPTESLKKADHFSVLPSVPSTQQIPAADIVVSNFFSLHRPLALGTTIPPTTSADAFNTLFEPRPTRDTWENGNSAERRPEDVIYALQNTVDALESESSAYRVQVVQWEKAQSAESVEPVKHIDGAPKRKTFDEIVNSFRPFNPPPPPEAFPEATLEKSKASKARQGKVQPRHKAYSTTITVLETTSEDGQRTYTASSTPIVPVNLESEVVEVDATSRTQQQRSTFAERMNQRQRTSLEKQRNEPIQAPSVATFVKRLPYLRKRRMLLISVKRQRKLKMKKHKYKKLMKRTRNLRRRQDRI